MSHQSWAVLRWLAVAAMLGWRWMPSEWAPSGLDRLRWAFRCDEIENLDRLLSQARSEQADHGYYNQILDTAPGGGELAQSVAEVRQIVLRPNLSVMRNDGTMWSTNALGMRDRPYAAAKPAGTLRVAMTGDSIGVGLGVNDGRGFEPLLELWLEEQSRRRGGPAVEVLNFALPGRSPAQRWDHFQKVGWATDPDLVLFEATAADVGWDQRRLSELLPRGIGWDSPLFGDVLTRSGIRPGATSEEYLRALAPLRWELLDAVYRAVAADCRARGVACLWVLIPRVGRFGDATHHRRLVGLARAAGFTAVVDVSDAFDGSDPAALAIHPSDFHPNAEGHALLARRLAGALWPLPAFRPLREPKPVASRIAGGTFPRGGGPGG